MTTSSSPSNAAFDRDRTSTCRMSRVEVRRTPCHVAAIAARSARFETSPSGSSVTSASRRAGSSKFTATNTAGGAPGGFGVASGARGQRLTCRNSRDRESTPMPSVLDMARDVCATGGERGETSASAIDGRSGRRPVGAGPGAEPGRGAAGGSSRVAADGSVEAGEAGRGVRGGSRAGNWRHLMKRRPRKKKRPTNAKTRRAIANPLFRLPSFFCQNSAFPLSPPRVRREDSIIDRPYRPRSFTSRHANCQNEARTTHCATDEHTLFQETHVTRTKKRVTRACKSTGTPGRAAVRATARLCRR